jgi:hypothetical protein
MKEWSIFPGVPTPGEVPAFAEKQVDALRHTQDELIDEVQHIADRWCARRHKTVEAMFDLGMTSLHNPGTAETAEAWMRWYNGALQRASEDTADQLELIATVAKSCGTGVFMPAIAAESAKAEPGNGKRKAK